MGKAVGAAASEGQHSDTREGRQIGCRVARRTDSRAVPGHAPGGDRTGFHRRVLGYQDQGNVQLPVLRNAAVRLRHQVRFRYRDGRASTSRWRTMRSKRSATGRSSWYVPKCSAPGAMPISATSFQTARCPPGCATASTRPRSSSIRKTVRTRSPLLPCGGPTQRNSRRRAGGRLAARRRTADDRPRPRPCGRAR